MVRKNFSPYGPSKAFLEAASRIWAQDLAGTGVTVNVLLPGGAVDTAADVTGVPTPGRTFQPASVMVPPILWLASDESNAHTGERFVASRWDESLPLAERIAAARDERRRCAADHVEPHSPLIPAKAGIQNAWLWVPAFAGTSGNSRLNNRTARLATPPHPCPSARRRSRRGSPDRRWSPAWSRARRRRSSSWCRAGFCRSASSAAAPPPSRA